MPIGPAEDHDVAQITVVTESELDKIKKHEAALALLEFSKAAVAFN